MKENGLYQLFIGKYSYGMVLKEMMTSFEKEQIDRFGTLFRKAYTSFEYKYINESGSQVHPWQLQYCDPLYVKNYIDTTRTYNLHRLFSGETPIGEIIFVATLLALRTSNPHNLLLKLANGLKYPVLVKENNEYNIVMCNAGISLDDTRIIIQAYYNKNSLLKLSVGEILMPISI